MIGISPEVPILLFWIPKKGSADSTGAQHLLVLGLELLIFIAHFVFMYLDKANYAWKKTEKSAVWTTKHFIDSLTFWVASSQPAPMREKIAFWQNIEFIEGKFLTYHQGQAFSQLMTISFDVFILSLKERILKMSIGLYLQLGMLGKHLTIDALIIGTITISTVIFPNE